MPLKLESTKLGANTTLDGKRMETLTPARNQINQTTHGIRIPRHIARRPSLAPAVAGYKKPWDLTLKPDNEFALFGALPGNVLTIGSSYKTPTSTFFTYDEDANLWNVNDAIAATSCIFLKVDRHLQTVTIDIDVEFKATDGRMEYIPKWYIPFQDGEGGEDGKIDAANIIDMRDIDRVPDLASQAYLAKITIPDDADGFKESWGRNRWF